MLQNGSSTVVFDIHALALPPSLNMHCPSNSLCSLVRSPSLVISLQLESERCIYMQVIYSRNGVKITSTPVEHYTTGGPSALRVDWNGLSFVYSGIVQQSQQ